MKEYTLSIRNEFSNSTAIILRDKETNYIISKLTVEKVPTEQESGTLLHSLTNNGQQCISIWDFKTKSSYTKQGYGRALMEYTLKLFQNKNIILVAQPDKYVRNNITLDKLTEFYQSLGFKKHKEIFGRTIMYVNNINK